MAGEVGASSAWTVASLVLQLVSGTMTWTMPRSVDDPSRVRFEPDLVQACWGNISEYHGSPRLSVLDGLVGIPAFLVRDTAGQTWMVTAVGVDCGP